MAAAAESKRRRLLVAAAAIFLVAAGGGAAVAAAASTAGSFETYNFTYFNDSNSDLFVKGDDSGFSQGAIQITPDSLNKPSLYLVNKSGRVFLDTPFQLWQPAPANSSGNATTVAASFHVSFLVNVYRVDNSSTPGEGLAFLIAPSTEPNPPPGSDGGFLGLTTAATDGLQSNKFVAVELDTVKQYYDPDDNHLGIDVNSVKSVATAPLSPLGIVIAPVVAANYTVWVDYDGAGRRLDVFMAREGVAKPADPALSHGLDLSEYLDQWSYFGFSGSTSENYELHCVLSWSIAVETLEVHRRRSKTWVALAAGVPAAALIAVAAGLACAYARWKRKMRVGDGDDKLVGALRSLPGTPREFKYGELKKATNNFDEKMKLGQGGFRIVYKGVLQQSAAAPAPATPRAAGGDVDGGGTAAAATVEVAVKKFSRDKCQGDFLAELTIINRLRHKNLVRLVGWCHENSVVLLVYDYMPNGSLDKHLYASGGGGDSSTSSPPPPLPWDRRYNIISGVASALHYLHDEYDQTVVHRDLKASNILLDADFNARLGDFGLARALETDKTSYAEIELGGVPGTLGYIAPECLHTSKFTRQSDIYAFGALLLEILCGRRPRTDIAGFHYLVDWVWKLYREGELLAAVDPRIDGGGEDGEQDGLARRLLLLGLACSHPVPAERPKAGEVMQVIRGAVPPPAVPRFRPAFVWRSGAEGGGDDATTTTSSSYYASSAAMGWSSDHGATSTMEIGRAGERTWSTTQ